MRLTSDLWVKALVRQVFSKGEFAVVERHGSPEAGAIFVRILGRDGQQALLAPAPQAIFDTAKPVDRTFETRLENCPGSEIDTILARERDFDPDFWVVEIETENPQDYLTLMPA
ncbi:DUF1491 family protein [Hoeflea prorocentri]|uniref:DUF1491 family protein n=1 Tax=Hoeflea prorocentri TaxID=1922333 RepID=A0A9X3UJ05_9HYPH|nr:DUF1491 family protein [Hoeflea prorocentri]MCY6381517.1 DUF1491 family protein [Hoeflea prorocentri]MDA5399317.1 DUF1491 family protein [Hoeflea prorocentri]